jgi:hypothetical protein
MRYPGLARPLVMQVGTGLDRALAEVLRGWEPDVEVTPRPQGRAIACVYPEAPGEEGFAVHSAFAEAPFRALETASAVCAMVADLGQGWFDERPGTLALHCGAFSIAGQLIAVSGAGRAGKSTLIARLTAEPDVEVWCDDILPVLPDGMAVGLGIAPRLRLPLPEAASAAFRDHVAATLGPRDARYGFVCAPRIAGHGTRGRLSALVRLDRRDGAKARLHALGSDAALTEVLTRNMAEQETPDEAFDRASVLLQKLQAFTLVYSDLEEAVALLRRAFGAGRDVQDCLTPGEAEPDVAESDDVGAMVAGDAALEPDIVMARSPGVAIRRMGGSAFLWRPDGIAIWHLNPVAAGVWALLDIPGSAREIGASLAEVFPQVPLETLVADVAILLDGLAEEGFVREAPEA